MLREVFGKELDTGDLVVVESPMDASVAYGIVVGDTQVFISYYTTSQTCYNILGDSTITNVVKLGKEDCYKSKIMDLYTKYQEFSDRTYHGTTERLVVGDVLESKNRSQAYIIFLGIDAQNRKVFLNFSGSMRNNGVSVSVRNKTAKGRLSRIVKSINGWKPGFDDYKTKVYHYQPANFNLYTGHVNIDFDTNKFTVLADNREIDIKLK